MKVENTDYILIAGASQGIGFAILEELISSYSSCHIIAISRNTSSLKSLGEKYPKRVSIIQADLSEIFSLEECLPNNAKLKGIIFTAGVLDKFELGSIKYSDFQYIYKNNVWSLINTVQCCLPYILNTHIVTIGSMGGVNNTLKFPEMSIYSSSKGAMGILSECFAEDFKVLNTSVNCLAIGAVNTVMMKKAFPDYTSNIDPQDIAPFICNFTLNSKELFNGKTIPVSSTSP